MRIAIPTYKRYETLNDKTLKYLIGDCKVDPKTIDCFVADEIEYGEYKKADKWGVNYIVGKPTLKGQRNFIDFYYEVGDFILQFDDDVEGVYKKVNDKETRLFTDIIKLANLGFAECVKNGTKLWGICAVHNPFYMTNNISYNLKYIEGAVFGQIITRDNRLSVSLEDKEDFERTILYFHLYKSIVRFNGFSMETKFYTEPGGMQETRTEDRVEKSAHILLKRWPQYCSLNDKKKSKWTEIKLNSRAV